MDSIKIGVMEIRGDLKATKKELKKAFGKWLSDDEITQLDKKLNPNVNNANTIQPKVKKVRKRKKH